MYKILLLEDIIPKAQAIKEVLFEHTVHCFHSAASFLYAFSETSFKQFINECDFFILDFDLGDASIMSASIYETILKNKKKSAILCCISSYGSTFIEEQCRTVYGSYGRKNAFDYYTKKDPEAVFEVVNHSQPQSTH